MANLKKANEIIDQIIGGLNLLKETLSQDRITAQSMPNHPPKANNVDLGREKSPTFADNSFESLKEAVSSPRWPQAVNPNYIIDLNSETDKEERGKGIIEMVITEPLENMKFLDFGCGEGHCAVAAHEYRTAVAVGYDVVAHANWKNVEGEKPLTFTDDFAKVVEAGPYDVILLYDVIDHAVSEHPENLLKKVAGLLKPNGKIYMRCHPFTSRHATHLYHDFNKAYVHLVFTPEELAQIVPTPNNAIPNVGVTRPIGTYKEWIEKAGLNILFRDDTPEPVEAFFKIPGIANRIIKNTGFDSFPDYQLGIQFLTYHLGFKNQT